MDGTSVFSVKNYIRRVYLIVLLTPEIAAPHEVKRQFHFKFQALTSVLHPPSLTDSNIRVVAENA